MREGSAPPPRRFNDRPARWVSITASVVLLGHRWRVLDQFDLGGDDARGERFGFIEQNLAWRANPSSSSRRLGSAIPGCMGDDYDVYIGRGEDPTLGVGQVGQSVLTPRQRIGANSVDEAIERYREDL